MNSFAILQFKETKVICGIYTCFKIVYGKKLDVLNGLNGGKDKYNVIFGPVSYSKDIDLWELIKKDLLYYVESFDTEDFKTSVNSKGDYRGNNMHIIIKPTKVIQINTNFYKSKHAPEEFVKVFKGTFYKIK